MDGWMDGWGGVDGWIWENIEKIHMDGLDGRIFRKHREKRWMDGWMDWGGGGMDGFAKTLRKHAWMDWMEGF